MKFFTDTNNATVMTILMPCLPAHTGERGRHCWMPAQDPVSPSKVALMNETDVIPTITELTIWGR